MTRLKRRVFDRTGVREAFKEIACSGVPVELSYAKGSIQEAARELDIDQDESANGDGRPLSGRPKKNDQTLPANTTLTDEQQQTKRLQRELREAHMERDILKKAVSIFSRGDGRYFDL